MEAPSGSDCNSQDEGKRALLFHCYSDPSLTTQIPAWPGSGWPRFGEHRRRRHVRKRFWVSSGVAKSFTIARSKHFDAM